MAFDPVGALEALVDGGVRFVVVGGIAATIHGSPSVTDDLDICPEHSRANLDRLAAVLVGLHARLRGAPTGAPFLLDGLTLERDDSFTFTTDVGDLDCLGTPSGTGGYEDLRAGAEEIDIDTVRVAVASIDDLMRMKRAAGRPKDRVELEILGALRDELEGDGEHGST